MGKLLKAEFYKLFVNRAFWGMMVFSLVLGSILMLDNGLPESAGSAFCSSLYNTPLLYFLPIIFCALFAGEDFENRTLQNCVASGHRRGDILLAKTVSYLTSCTLMLAVPIIVHGLAGIAVFGAEGGAYLPSAAGNKAAVLSAAAYRVTVFSALGDGAVILFALLAMGMLPLLCTFLCRDVGKSLAVPAVIYFMMIFVLNSDRAKEIAQVLPMGQLRLMSLGQLDASRILIIVIDIIWIAACFTGAYLAIVRSDLK